MKKVLYLATLFLGAVLFVVMVAVSVAILAATAWSISYAFGHLFELTAEQVKGGYGFPDSS